MGFRVLVVEDDVEIARIISSHLKSEGFDVQWASTGVEGLEDFKKDFYDILIVDVMMPEMDGFTLCKNIRLISDIPVLILSAKREEIDKIKGLRLGADDYMTKPFSLAELTARVESHIRRYKKLKGTAVSTEKNEYEGGLIIDRGSRSVTLKGRQINLTSKEYDILLLLAGNENRVFTKQELYENIWNQMDVDGNNTVTVHIKELREKLGENIKNPKFIQTVWGTGYVFTGERL